MRFKGLDLNLVLAFDALLTSRSVTRAAERMHLSQAAMSSALGRLREYFGDEILVISGKRMYPTAFAETLHPQVRNCMRQLEELVSTAPGFDPSTSQRSFRIVASDYVTAVALAPLVSRIAATAPGVRIDILQPSDLILKQIEDGEVDLLITPEGYSSPDLPTELLFEDRHVVVGWAGNELMHGPITREQFLAAGHVSVSIGNRHTNSFADQSMEIAGHTRRIEVIAASFTTVPMLIEHTCRLAVMYERLALSLSPRYAIRSQPLPFDIPPLREVVQHHFARAKDEGLIWIRSQLREVFRSIEPVNAL